MDNEDKLQIVKFKPHLCDVTNGIYHSNGVPAQYDKDDPFFHQIYQDLIWKYGNGISHEEFFSHMEDYVEITAGLIDDDKRKHGLWYMWDCIPQVQEYIKLKVKEYINLIDIKDILNRTFVNYENRVASDIGIRTRKKIDEKMKPAYSGKFNLRISPELHKKLVAKSIELDCSLNMIVSSILEIFCED